VTAAPTTGAIDQAVADLGRGVQLLVHAAVERRSVGHMQRRCGASDGFFLGE
jgi:hypothetical protein